MDLKKVTLGNWLIAGGTIVFIIGYFLDWFKYETDLGAFGGTFSTSVSGDNYGMNGTLPLLLFIAVTAFVAITKFVPNVKLPDNVPWSLIVLIVAGVGALLVLLRLLIGEDSGIDRAIGLYLASVGAVAVAVGALLDFLGGKGKSAPSAGSGFGGGATPPPPSGM